MSRKETTTVQRLRIVTDTDAMSLRAYNMVSSVSSLTGLRSPSIWLLDKVLERRRDRSNPRACWVHRREAW